MRFKILDSTSTVGAGKTGLTSASGGLIIGTIADNEAATTVYTAAGSTTETITTLGTYAAPTATKCRFKEVDATNHPGLYEIQLADARFAVSNAKSLIVTVQVTGGAQVDAEIQLSATDPNDAVRGGMTALPNAAAQAAGGLYTRGTGAGQINQAADGMIDTNPVRLNNVSQSLLDLKDFADDGYDPSTNKLTGLLLADAVTTVTTVTNQVTANVTQISGDTAAADNAESFFDGTGYAGTNNVIPSVTTVTGNVNGSVASVAAMVTANTIQLSGDATAADNAESFFDGTGYAGTNNVIPTVTTVGTLTTYTGNTPQTGDAFARLGAPVGASISADVAGVQSDTNDIQTRLPAALVSGRMSSDAVAISGSTTAADNVEANIANLDAAVSTRATPAQVNTEVDTALADVRLDELLFADSDIDGAAPPAVGSVFHELLTKTSGSFTYDQSTDSLEALRDNLALASALATVQADTDDIQSKIGTPAGASLAADIAAIEDQTDEIGANGAGLTAVPWNPAWDAEVQSEAADALVAYDAATGTDVTTATANLDVAVSTRATPAQVNTEVDTALADVRLDELLFADSDIDGAAPPAVGSVFHELLTKTPGSFTYDQTTDSLEALADGAAPSAGTIADAVWDEARVGHVGAGSFGEGVASVTGSIGSVATGGITALSISTDAIGANEFSQAAADKVWASATRTLTAFGFSVTVGTNGDKTGYTLSAPGVQAIWDALTSALTTLGSIGKLFVDNLNATITSRATPAQAADAVWDETLTDHLTSGSTGNALNAAGSAGDPWSTALPGAYGAGTAGKIVGDNVDAMISSRLATAGYTTPPTAPANADAVWDELLSGHIGAGSSGEALSNAGMAADPWGTALPGAYGAGSAGNILGNQLDASVSSRATPAQVNAQVLDVLTVDTFPEPTLMPDETCTMFDRIAMLFMSLRNRVRQTETSQEIWNDAEDTPVATAVCSESAGESIRSKFES